MQKLLYCLVFISFSQIGFSQQNRFIYIQTENKQPFYIKLDKKIFSSASSGYVIIPKLIDGTYNLSIGFPKNEWPAQNIQCTVNKKDVGYLLKNFGDKGWGLFNLQTLDVVMATSSNQNNNATVAKDIKTDSFTTMLSEVVKDPSIKESVIITPTVIPTVIKEDVVATSQLSNTLSVPTKITRTLYNTNAEGTEMIYIDASADKVDTIRVFIPADKISAVVVPEKKMEEIKKEPIKEEKSDVVITKTGIPTSTVAAQSETDNPNCKNQATTDDFIKLRKKMVAADNDDDMVAAAKKVFKTKCFTTEQIKNLSVFFLKDEGKYQFFDAAYPYVSDISAFKTLQSLLTEEYYINRFKVMIH